MSVVHLCPPEGSGVMPCCQRLPLEAAMTDRMTVDPWLVTCGLASVRSIHQRKAAAVIRGDLP